MLKPTLRAECIAEVVDEARIVIAPQLQPGVVLRVKLDAAARDGIFECDRLWLAQILINLGQVTLSRWSVYMHRISKRLTGSKRVIQHPSKSFPNLGRMRRDTRSTALSRCLCTSAATMMWLLKAW